MSFFGKPSGAEPRITYERIDLTANGAMLAPAPRQVPALPGLSAMPRQAPPAATVVRSGALEPVTMLIAADSEMEGRLRSRGAVRIEGVLRGELQAASVVVEPGGLIEGLVTVEHAVINGTLRGTVVARDIEISRTATVDAELVYEEIGIERGARVHGLHRRREPEAPVPVPADADALSLSMAPPRAGGPGRSRAADRRSGRRGRGRVAGAGRGGAGRRRRLRRAGAGRGAGAGGAGWCAARRRLPAGRGHRPGRRYRGLSVGWGW